MVNKYQFVGEKHRIPSPTRESGDGMESTECTSQANKVELSTLHRSAKATKPPKTRGKKMIILPQTGLAVKKLPPIIADRDVRLPPKTPTSPLVQV